MTQQLRSKMIALANSKRHTGRWKNILYMLCYGAEMRDIRNYLDASST